MKYRAIDEQAVALRLDPDDDIHVSIEKVFLDLGWKSGLIWGLGSVVDPVLAHYKITKKEYSEMPLPGIYELTSINGTVAQLSGNISIHLHTTLSDEKMRAYGGHLVRGRCSATAEIILRQVSKALIKKHQRESGLNVWDF